MNEYLKNLIKKQDAEIRRVMNSLQMNADAARENPLIGNPELLDEARALIYTLREQLEFEKPYDRSKAD